MYSAFLFCIHSEHCEKSRSFFISTATADLRAVRLFCRFIAAEQYLSVFHYTCLSFFRQTNRAIAMPKKPDTSLLVIYAAV